MHALPTVTSENFRELTSRTGFVFVECWATWCGPCKTFAPVFADTARGRDEHVWATLDTDAEPAIAAALDVRAAPSVVVFRDGTVVYKHVGAMPARKFAELVDRLTGKLTPA